MAAVIPLLTAAGTWLASGTGIAATTAATAGLGAYAAISSGNAAAASAHYQQRVLNNQAKLGEQNARQELFRSEIAAQRGDFEAATQIADIISDQAASGLSGASGSKFLLVSGLRGMARLDAADVRNEGDVNARNLRLGAQADRTAARFQGMTAANARTESFFGVLSSFLGGAKAYQEAKAQGLIT